MKENDELRLDKGEIIRSIIGIVAMIGVMVVAVILLWDKIALLGTEEGRLELERLISSFGFLGWLLTLGIQVLQIVLAVLPGEPVELMLGALWGPFFGTLTCLLGILLGTVAVYFLARLFGKPLVRLVVGDRESRRYAFLSDPTRLNITVFILFFIPGTPKDVLTYLVPLTPISPVRYFFIATFARLPSVITSTVLGDSVLRGDVWLSVTVFVITAVISILGIFFGNRYLAKRNAEHSQLDEDDDTRE